MTCATFETELGEFLEGSLDDATQAACERHRAACASCAALVADLDAIVTSAASLPLPAMPRDFWPDIEARLETPVLDLSSARASHGASVASARPALMWRRLAVAAVALVTVSAGVTWNIARRAGEGVATVAQGTAPDADDQSPVTLDLPANDATGLAAQATTAANATGNTATLASAPRPVALDTIYGREIAMLRTVAEENLGLLDSSTVAVVRRNLDIIDRAIRESREALATDPNSGFLLEQLDRAYERKVDLLRRLATL
jgi:hypothetical protein